MTCTFCSLSGIAVTRSLSRVSLCFLTFLRGQVHTRECIKVLPPAASKYSSGNKLPLMILDPRSKLQKMGFPEEQCLFLQTKCLFLQKNGLFLLKNALSFRKIRLWGGHAAENRRKSQEGFRAQESRMLGDFRKKYAPPPPSLKMPYGQNLGELGGGVPLGAPRLHS